MPGPFRYWLPVLTSLSLLGNGYLLLNKYEENHDPKKAILNAFKTFSKTPEPEKTYAAVAVLAANRCDITMYGKTVVNELIDEEKGRIKYEIHPYRKAGVGTNIIPLYHDNAGDTYVLLGRKYLNPLNKQLGLEKNYILLGGYMQPHPLETTAKGPVKDLEGDEKDFIEEDLLRGGSGYAKKIFQSLKTVSKKESEYDINLKATAIRELEEEAGLMATEAKDIYSAGVYSTYPYANDPRLHTIVEDYVFDFGVNKPMARAGSDIAELRWVNVKNIAGDLSNTALKEKSVQSNEFSRFKIALDNGKVALLRDYDGEALFNALSVYEEKRLNKIHAQSRYFRRA